LAVSFKAVDTIRYSIISQAPDAQELFGSEIELDKTYLDGRRKGKRGRGTFNKVPVFGIFERKGMVKVEVEVVRPEYSRSSV